MPHCGLLDRPGILDGDTDVIVDELPLDYSILEEIDYEYPAKDCYLAYMTRVPVHAGFVLYQSWSQNSSIT